MRKKNSSNRYRSKFEERIAESLIRRKIKFKYEEKKYKLEKTVQGYCRECGNRNLYRNGYYVPDWFIYKGRKLLFIVETKGKFTAENRKTMVAFKEQYPDLDIRLVFMRDNRLAKQSKTLYSEWAEKNGFTYAFGDIPDEWL